MEALALKVKRRTDGEIIYIKPDRFNPENHVKIHGETPKPLDIGDVKPVERIVVDKMAAAVEDGQRKAKEETESKSEEKMDEPQDTREEAESVGEAAEVEGTPYGNLTVNDLRNMVKGRGLDVNLRSKKADLIAVLVADDNARKEQDPPGNPPQEENSTP